MFCSMAAGLSWFKLKPAHDHLKPAKDQQLKPAAMLQNIPNQHMLDFSTGW